MNLKVKHENGKENWFQEHWHFPVISNQRNAYVCGKSGVVMQRIRGMETKLGEHMTTLRLHPDQHELVARIVVPSLP